MAGDRPRTTDGSNRAGSSDGRRGGPIAVGEPSAEDRDQVAAVQRDSAERVQREREAMAAAAEPAGVPPSDEQREAIEGLRARSAQVRGPVARALRRQPVAVGVVYDDERDQVAELLDDARAQRIDDAARRGIADPTLEAQSAGFDPELPNLPGHELYGMFDCPNCGNQVERAFPGYVDWDLASRDLVCQQCGGLVKRGGAAGQAEPPPTGELAERAPNVVDQQQGAGQIQPPGVQTSAQGATAGQQPGQGAEALPSGTPGQTSGPGAQPLTADERAELEQLRAERAARSQETAEPDQGDQEPQTPAPRPRGQRQQPPSSS